MDTIYGAVIAQRVALCVTVMHLHVEIYSIILFKGKGNI